MEPLNREAALDLVGKISLLTNNSKKGRRRSIIARSWPTRPVRTPKAPEDAITSPEDTTTSSQTTAIPASNTSAEDITEVGTKSPSDSTVSDDNIPNLPLPDPNLKPPFTIVMKDTYNAHNQIGDPSKLFDPVASYLEQISSWSGSPDHKTAIVERELHEALSRAITGSNALDRVGLPPEPTLKLCHRIFSGDIIDTIESAETADTKAVIDAMMGRPGGPETDYKALIRGRNEVIHHATAMQYLLDCLLVEGERFTEDLIQRTHAVLCHRLPTMVSGIQIKPEEYAGKYRTTFLGLGSTLFTPPTRVPESMALLMYRLNIELNEALMDKMEFDLFHFAAKYCLKFFLIHPFQDGNGRMARIILNALLCQYAGVAVPIGEEEADREEYMAIIGRALAEMTGHGELATFVLLKARTGLRAMKRKLAGTQG